MRNKHTYWYIGPVTSFGKLLMDKWVASTRATSESEAKRNLLYQYKKSNNLLPTARIELPGKVELVA